MSMILRIEGARVVSVKENDKGSEIDLRIAANRNYKNKEGQYDSDFATVKVFSREGKNPQYKLVKSFTKGQYLPVVEADFRNDNFEKDGKTVYRDSYILSRLVLGPKAASSAEGTAAPAPASPSGDGFMSIPDGDDDELPFS